MDWVVNDPALGALLNQALAVRDLAYAPYSRFSVGAVIQLSDGGTVCGCNVENASYGLTVCAERVAVQRAVAEGRLGANVQITAVAVVGASAEPLTPCGACRQVLSEFAGASCLVHCANTAGAVRSYPLAELLPASFTLR